MSLLQALTQDVFDMMRTFGCDPHCHFCFKPLAIGDSYSLKRLKPGISGTACEECTRLDRPAPEVAIVEAEERRAAHLRDESPPHGRGFLVFDS